MKTIRIHETTAIIKGEGLKAQRTVKKLVAEAFCDANITKVELARRICKNEGEVRRILDPDHATKMSTLSTVMRALGKRFTIGVKEIAK